MSNAGNESLPLTELEVQNVESPVPKYIAEFVGTYLLVFTVGCNVLSANAVWGGTSIGCVLMVSIYALGGVSGANFNPAVSAALGLSGKLPAMDVCLYMLVQVVAAICGAFSYKFLFSEAFSLKPFNLEPNGDFGLWHAMLAEALYTLMLCFVVLNTAAASKNTPNQFYGLAIGFVIIAGAYGAGSISGGCFNPAVAIGIATSSAFKGGMQWVFVYTAAELVGAALAAGLFRVVRPDDFGGCPTYDLGPRVISEFLGTFFLVLTVGLNVLADSPAGAWSIAASLMCMIFALGNCSGAHFNPAVTLSIVLSGREKCSPADGAAYVVAQLSGGLCAAFTYSAMYSSQPKNSFALRTAGSSYGSIAAAEIFATFVLCFVVLSVATVDQPLSEYFGLAIGACITACGAAIGNISGGSLNPAVSFGISSSHALKHGGFSECILYTVFEALGAVLAAGVFYAVRPKEYKKSLDM